MKKDFRLETTPANAHRRPELAMDDEWIQNYLNQAQVGQLATRWDDQPFITPTNFWYDDQQNKIIFHSNIVGRVRANIERHPRACFAAYDYGRLLPSNVALEFSVQYSSVIAYGLVEIINDPIEKERALYGLLRKYFPDMKPGEEYRPITSKELDRTTVYAFHIESWSGKKNWPYQADQSDKWPLLDAKWLQEG